MSSKEKPKKIGILGTDGKMYNFLLKFDKQGDLRKEQRFIEFANLCNKMLEQDKQASLRGLHLRTYSITPLSKCAGLIEWIQNTSTMKTLVTDHWKRNSIKGDMSEIKKMAQQQNKGETHTQIW
jgi:serine/threonine-protein kinase ATR